MSHRQHPLCERTGKVAYPTRREARRRGRAALPGEHLSAYRHGQHWHVGHLPQAAMEGVKSRREVYGR